MRPLKYCSVELFLIMVATRILFIFRFLRCAPFDEKAVFEKYLDVPKGKNAEAARVSSKL